MATIQVQMSAGIGWSLHTLAPGAARSMCVCVCTSCMFACGWEGGRGWRRLLLVAALLEAWHDENQKPSPATKCEEKSLKWFQAKSLCIKSRKFYVKKNKQTNKIYFKAQRFKKILSFDICEMKTLTDDQGSGWWKAVVISAFVTSIFMYNYPLVLKAAVQIWYVHLHACCHWFHH